MIDSLLKIIGDLWYDILPVFVVDEYERGVVLRFGKLNRVVNPGIGFKIPLSDRVLTTSVVPTTMPLFAQSVTTKDDKSIVVRAIVKYRVSDPEVFLLRVNDATDAISDSAQGIIRKVISRNSYDRCRTTEIEKTITKLTSEEAKYWGIDIMTVTITDIGIIRTFRLIKDSTDNDN